MAPVNLSGLDEFPGAPDVPETGVTFATNALLKARAIAAYHRPARGRRRLRPVRGRAERHARRVLRPLGGRHGDDPANLDLVLAQVADVPDPHLGAQFVCAAALVVPGPAPGRGGDRAAWTGRLSGFRAAPDGFGYDPIFLPDGVRPDHGRDDRGGQRTRSATAAAPSAP